MNNQLEILGIAITQYYFSKVLHRDVAELAHEKYGDALFKTYIRGNIALAESQSMGKNIFDYDDTCNGAEDYMELTKEVIRRVSAELAV